MYTNHPKSYLFDAARQLSGAATMVKRAADANEKDRRALLLKAQSNINAALARIAADI